METATKIRKVLLKEAKGGNKVSLTKVIKKTNTSYFLVSKEYKSLLKSKEIVPPTSKSEAIKNIGKIIKKFNKHGKDKFHNAKGEKKQLARETMVNAIENSRASKGTILTLPYKHCIIEKMILDRVSKRYNFMACELDQKVFNAMLMTIAKNNLPMNVHRGGIGEKIEQAKENEYSHLILDYCGQLGTFHKEIQMAIEKNIVEVDGTISITLNKRITPNTEYIYEKMEQLNPRQVKNELTRTEHALRTFINRVGGMGYAIESTLNYHDNTSMILMIVRRIS